MLAVLNINVEIGSGYTANIAQNSVQLCLLGSQLSIQSVQLGVQASLGCYQSLQLLVELKCESFVSTVTASCQLFQSSDLILYSLYIALCYPLCPYSLSHIGTVGNYQVVQIVQAFFGLCQGIFYFVKSFLSLGIGCEYCGGNNRCYHAEHDQHCNTGPEHSRKTCFHNYLLNILGNIGLLHPNFPIFYIHYAACFCSVNAELCTPLPSALAMQDGITILLPAATVNRQKPFTYCLPTS